jgi:hypothetical protein
MLPGLLVIANDLSLRKRRSEIHSRKGCWSSMKGIGGPIECHFWQIGDRFVRRLRAGRHQGVPAVGRLEGDGVGLRLASRLKKTRLNLPSPCGDECLNPGPERP